MLVNVVFCSLDWSRWHLVAANSSSRTVHLDLLFWKSNVSELNIFDMISELPISLFLIK
jgi:hypothetical protein